MREDERLDVKLTFGRIVVVSCFIEVLSVISICKYNVFCENGCSFVTGVYGVFSQ